MGLITKLDAALREQSCLPSTMQCYRFWNRRFFDFIKKPASQWTGPDVRAFLIFLHGDVARGVSPLDVVARPAPVLVNLGGLLE